MVDLLIKLLGPFMYSLGVSEADLLSYLTQLEGYIYGIIIAAIVLIAVMFLAHFAKKGFRHVLRIEAVMAFLAAIVIIVNSICYGPMYSNVSGFLNASKAEFSEETIANSRETIKKIGEEGITLVKNEGLLPLSSDVTSLNVFGWDSTNPIFGGTGSAGSHSEGAIGILQSLQDAGYKTNESLSKMYTDYYDRRPVISMQAQDWSLPEPNMGHYTDELMEEARSFSDTAVIVIGRPGGEGADLPTDMNAVIKGTYNQGLATSNAPKNWRYMNASYANNGSYDDFEEGEHYLELSVTEEQMVDKVCSEFDNVIVIINANNAMELGWVDEYEQIKSVLLAPGGGSTGFAALGEILNGSVNPSGKTADTYVKDLLSTQYINNIGNFPYNNVGDLKAKALDADASYKGNISFVNYVEGIYVGYKFYETAAEEGLIDYGKSVQYPFGYGLSYTTFEKTMKNFKDNGDTVSFDVEVTNTGDTAGKDVAEIYFTPPYTNGGIEKASVNLIEFQKTELLEPGKSQTLSFEIAKENMASYDSNEIKVAGGGYILEAGEYVISVRSDSHTVVAEETFTVEEDIDYSKDGRSTDQTTAVNVFQDYTRGDFVELSRADGFKNAGDSWARPTDYAMSDELRAAVEENTFGIYDSSKYDNTEDEMPVMGADNKLTLFDLKGADYDDTKWEELLDQLSFEDMATMINVGGWQTAEISSVGKIATSDCDGPAGLNNFVTKTYGTPYPCEVLLAQTWNKELAYEAGESMGQEFADVKNYGWYGPAMNTHRSAFSGRNFEYYCEDGVLAGYLAMNQANGAAVKGVYPYIKHFAVNDQECNRESFLLTFVSEQAMREIYLKPFELCIKGFDGKAMACMSSYNWLGSQPACANADLLQTVLRDEWGFRGMVISDYDGSYGYMISENCMRNGNDLMLGYANAASNEFHNQSATAVTAMRKACKSIMYTIVNSGAYAGNENPVGGLSNMDKLFLKINIVSGIVIVGIAVLVLVHYLLKKKKGEKTAEQSFFEGLSHCINTMVPLETEENMEVKDIISRLTIEEKAALLSGKNEWESRDIPRLEVPSITFSDGPHGLRRQEGAGDHLGLNASLPATCFPTAATTANSWDISLGEKIGEALGEEAAAQGVNVVLGPGLNMKRSPLCGRNFEYFSEDPILAGKMAAAYVRGIQSKHVYACPKHFAVNSRESLRMAMNAVVDERTLREIYLTAFEIAIKEGNAKSIMSSYNEVNGKYANENEHLLVDILRKEWGFDGIVVTDWGASNDHTEGVKCQSNVEMPNPGLDSARGLLEDLRLGKITEKEIDRAIEPIIEAAIYFKENQAKDFNKETHHRIARQAAVESAVLLKNEKNILPLKEGTKVALRGPFVNKPRYQGAGSSQVNATRVETIVEEIKNYNLKVVEDPKAADVVLFFFGLDEIAESEGADRISMDIPEYQIKELEEIAVLNTNVVGVMSAGSAVKMPWLNKVTALLHGYLTGQAGAGALLDLITGKEVPTGKLAESYPFAYADCSMFNYADEKYRNLQYREGPFIGYRYYDTADIAVQFPFGYGLSYTTFAYDSLVVTEEGVRFTITNTGMWAGAEIAQLYVGKKESKLVRPKKELKGFAKIWLEAGESKEVEIRFDDKTFRYFNTETDQWEIEGGAYTIMIGASSADIRLWGEMEKQGTTDVVPYDIEKLPSYKSGLVRNVHYEEFQLLYGDVLPEEKVGLLDINDALCQMKYAKNGICRLVYKILQSKLDKAAEKGVPDLNTMFIYNMPFRAISKMTAGMVSREMAESIVTIANGHFFRGVGGVIGGFFRNRRANKKYEALLKNGK